MNDQNSSSSINNPLDLSPIQNITPLQKMNMLTPFLLILLISAGVFGFSGYYLGKNLPYINSSKTTEIINSERFSSETQQPEPNSLYRGTVSVLVQSSALKTEDNIDVVFLTNWVQGYNAGIADDPFTGKLNGRKTYSNGSEKKIDTYSDFRKIEKPIKLVSFGEKPVTKLFDSLVSNLNNKIFVFVSFASETRDGKPKYSIFEIDTANSTLKEIWSYDLQVDSQKINVNELSPSFGELTNKYLTFSVNGHFNSWEGKNTVLNLETGAVKYLRRSVDVKIDIDDNTVSYKPVGNLNVKYYSSGGYTPEQIAKIEAATGQAVKEPLP